VGNSKEFTSQEIDYGKNVLDNFLEECSQTVDALSILISANELQMKDDQRMKRIENILNAVQDCYSLISSFAREIAVLSVQRAYERAEIKQSQILNGVE
jgi:hypothetical protein